MQSLPTQVSRNADNTVRQVTVVIDGKVYTALDEAGDQVLAVLGDLTLDEATRNERLLAVFSPAKMLADFVDGERVTIDGGRVLFDGENVPTSLTNKILKIARLGLDTRPWQRFVVRLFANPSRGAQAELNEFLEAADLPITDDGCFYAYKRVSDDYMSIASGPNGHLDNSIGNVVEMDRDGVDPDRDRTCSHGLHFCSKDYLRNFYGGRGRIVIVKVSPTDVVSIPSDYQYTKGRTCRYEVVGEVDLSAENAGVEWGIYNNSFSTDDADYDDPLGWDAEYDEEEAEEVAFKLVNDEWGVIDESDELADLIDYAEGFGEYCYVLDAEGVIVWESNTDDDDEFPPAVEEAPKLTRLQALRAKFGRS